MENRAYSDELQHHGIKGMRWGVRRYQNPDGSLTAAGQKRYNKEVAKLNKEKAKLKSEERTVSSFKRNQSKLDKLEAEKKAVADRKKALEDEKRQLKKGKSTEDEDPHKPKKITAEERKLKTREELREKLLKSTDPDELYKNRDLLSTEEINERLNRINTEQRLSAVANANNKTVLDRVNKAIEYGNKADQLYKLFRDSSIGKDIKKSLGLNDQELKEFDLDDFYKNINRKSDQQVAAAAKRVTQTNVIKKALDELDKK